jgi:hypothetical protein
MTRRAWAWLVIGITLFAVAFLTVVGLAVETGDRHTSTPRVVVVTVSPAPAPTVTKRVKVPGPTRTVSVNKYPPCPGDMLNGTDYATSRRLEAAGGCIWHP